jgi:ABC-type nitrate/sulfonate/bicarbonate transport system substrate-binding protein/predicted secreted protein
MSAIAARIIRALASATFTATCLLGSIQRAPADDALTVMSGGNTSGIFDVLEFVAGGAGFYNQQHLNVTKEYGGNPGTAAQLVASGKADVASIPVEPVFAGYDKGLRLQFFLARQARHAYVLAVLADSPIRALADFKGSVLAETTVASPGEVLTGSMLAGAGLKKSDYAFQMTGFGPAGLAAITSKRVDGAAFPYLEIVNDEVIGNLQFRTFRHPILKDIPDVGYAASPATIQTKADALQRFSRAIVEAALFVRTNPAAGARLYLQGAGQKITPELLLKTTRILTLLEDDFPAADPSNKRIGLLSPKSMDLYGKYLADYGFTRAPVPGSAIATDQFVAFANDFDHAAVVQLAKDMPLGVASAAKLVTITDKNDGQTIALAVGQQLDVRLPANPTTGFQWTAGALHAGPLAQTHPGEFQPAPSGALGAGGTEAFSYRATAAGTAHLAFAYARSWEHTAPAKRVTVTIDVR